MNAQLRELRLRQQEKSQAQQEEVQQRQWGRRNLQHPEEKRQISTQRSEFGWLCLH